MSKQGILLKAIMSLTRTKIKQFYITIGYHFSCKRIKRRIRVLKKIVSQCEPINLLKFLDFMTKTNQMKPSIDEISIDDSIFFVHAQEYIQTILVTTENNYKPCQNDERTQENLFNKALNVYKEIHDEILLFLMLWSQKESQNKNIESTRIDEIIESQLMYWVRGNRYQLFELEPIKQLLSPHNDILVELFNISSNDVVSGLDKLRYSLSQGYADAIVDSAKSFDRFSELIDSGVSEGKAVEIVRDDAETAMNQLFNCGLNDVKKITNWSDEFISCFSLGLNEQKNFWGKSSFSGWPIDLLPVYQKPFIRINNEHYCFLYYDLFDNIYRSIQKSIVNKRSNYRNTWNHFQSTASEKMVADLFAKLLPGASIYKNNYYPINGSLKNMNENDLIVAYYNYLFVVEVKAGSFPPTPPITDFNAHIKAYESLANNSDSQCSRTMDYIKSCDVASFYDENKQPSFKLAPIDYYNDIFTFSVTVENFNEFASKAEKMSVFNLKEKTIVISIDDLLVYADYFNSPIAFIHYLKQRTAAMSIQQYQMHDEMDHLGLYINQNCYALDPTKYGDGDIIIFEGFREELDKYYAMRFSCPKDAIKPIQNHPKEITKIIRYIDNHPSVDLIALELFLLDLSSDGKTDLAEQIKYILKRQKELKYMVPAKAFGEIKYCMFLSQPGIKNFSTQECIDYTLAAASRNEDVPVMCIMLKYNKNNNIISIDSKSCNFSSVSESDYERLIKLGHEKAKHWVKAFEKVHGRIDDNEECPCGSGKTYKDCCKCS